MRLPSSVALTLSLLTNMAPQFARVATAQAVVLYNDGLAHSSLGAAVGTVDPLLRRYHAGNLGSSGQDGTSIDLPVGGLGCTVAWPNYDAEFSTPGCTHTLELGCTVAGAVRVAAKLTVVRNLDGSENLVSDFSGVHGDNWVALLDGSGATVSMTCCKPTYDVKANKKVAPQYSDYQTTGVPSSAVWATVSSPNSTEQSIEVVYPTAMLVTVDGVTTECRGVRFFRNTGDAVSSIGPFAIKGAWPASAGTGSFTLESEMTDPPCAGLNCPNGPGTSFQALGNARWLTGGGSGAMGIANIGSSGQDGCRESPSRPSLGQTRPPVKALTMVIANPSPASDLNPGLMVWRGEGRSGVNPLYQELCTMTSTLSGGQMHCVPDFSSCGATRLSRAALPEWLGRRRCLQSAGRLHGYDVHARLRDRAGA